MAGHRFPLKRTIIRLALLGWVLAFFIAHDPLHTKPAEYTTPPQISFQGSKSLSDTPKLSADVTWSCSNFEAVYGPNYYNQLYISWATWDRILASLPLQGAADVTPLVNYQYNISARQAYNLYVASLQRNGCTPTIKAPAVLSPAAALNGSFSPSGFNVNTQVSCNVPLAAQFLNNTNQQLATAAQNIQNQMDGWASDSASRPFGPEAQQQATSFSATLYATGKNLVQDFQQEASAVGC